MLHCDADLTFYYYYDPASYTVTVNYLDAQGNKIAESYVSQPYGSGLNYNVENLNAPAISGYTYLRTEGDPLSGVFDGNKVINVYYAVSNPYVPPVSSEPTDPNVPSDPHEPPTSVPEREPSSTPEVIEDPSVPLAEPPVDPSEPSYEEIEDSGVPLAEIPDEEVLLIDYTPQTSDESNLSLWLVILGASALGLVVALAFEKKNRYTPKHYR